MGLHERNLPIHHQQLADLEMGWEGGTPATPAGRRHLGIRGTRPWAWVLLALIVAVPVAAFVIPDGALRELHLEAPKETVHTPVYSSHAVGVLPIRGPKSLVYGTLFIVTGRGTPYPGDVVVLGSWNKAPLRQFASSDSQDEPFHFVIDIDHHGALFLKVVRPDGQIWEGTFRVVDHSPDGNPAGVSTGTA